MAIFRVAADGSDLAAGSLSAPWKTYAKIASAINTGVVVDGDVVIVDPGVEHDLLVDGAITFQNKSFASGVRIIKGGGGLGADPLISGDDLVAGISVNNCEGLFFGDFEIADVGLGIDLQDCVNVTLHAPHIHDVYGTGVLVGSFVEADDTGRDLTIEHADVHDTTADGLTSGSAIRTVVRYSHFHDHGIGQASDIVDAVAFHGVTEDFCEVHHCIIENVEGKAAVGANFNGGIPTVSGVSFNFNAAAGTVARATGSWAVIFSVGSYFKVTGSEASGANDGLYKIAARLTTVNPDDTLQIVSTPAVSPSPTYLTAFAQTNAADTTATIQRQDGSRVFSHNNFIRNVTAVGINSLESLSQVVAQNNVIVTPDRWFGRPFVAVSATFSAAADSIVLAVGSWASKFAVGDLFLVSGATNPAVEGLYKIASITTTTNPNDTVNVVTTAPGFGEPARLSAVAASGAMTATIEYAPPFNLGASGLYVIDGALTARNNTVYNLSRSEDPATLSHMVSSFVMVDGGGGLPEMFSYCVNNVSVCDDDTATHVVWSTTYPGGFDYSCYWPGDTNPTGNGRFYITNFATYIDFAAWSTTHDTHGFVADPGFIGDPSLDPRMAALATSSPCIGAGIDMSGDSYFPMAVDFRDRPRPDGGWDIGAFQVGGVQRFRSNRSSAHIEVQVTGSGCIGVRLSVTYEEGDAPRSAGVLLYRVFKPADYATTLRWSSAAAIAGTVILARDLDPGTLYFVEVLIGRLPSRVVDLAAPTNLERFREPEDAYADFGPSGMFVEIEAFVADVGADVRPIDWSGVVAETFNVLLIGTDAEDGVLLGSSGERRDTGVLEHYAARVCSAVATDFVEPRRLNLLSTAYTDQRIVDLQFPHVFSDGTVVTSLANYRAGIGVDPEGAAAVLPPHQSDPGSAGAMFGMLTLLRNYEAHPHLVVFALGLQDMVEYDPTDTTWETTAAAAYVDLVVRALTEFDHCPRVVVVYPHVAGPKNAAGQDAVRAAISAAVATLRAAPYHARSVDVAVVDLLAEVSAAPGTLGPWLARTTAAQHAWLSRSGGAFDVAVRASFAHIL